MESFKANKQLMELNKTLSQEDILLGLKEFASEKTSILFDSIELEKFSKLISRYFEIEKEKQREQKENFEEVIIERNSILSNIPLGIMMLDANLNINWANESITKMYDYEPEEIVGKNWYQVVPSMKERKQIYEKVLSGESFDFPESEFVLKEGVQFFDVHYRPIRNKNGKIKGMLIIGNVFIENNKIEKVLKKQKSKLIRMAKVFNEINQPIILANPEGFIEMVNEAACNQYQKKENDFLDEHIINLYTLTEYQTAKKYSNIIKNREYVEFESVHLKSDGSNFPVNVNITSVKTIEGKPIYQIINTRDISERKKTEKKLKAYSDNLERVNKELEEYTYITAHDLKAPLTNIKNLIELLDVQEISNQESKELLCKIKQSVNIMNSVVFTLGDIVSFREGLNKKKENIKFENVFNGVVDSISFDIQNTFTQIETDFRACQYINYPKVHLESILLNVITNSIKYRKQNISPIIKIKTFKNDKNQICLTISDNGIGFDAKDKKNKIFSLFKRLHTHVAGNGVGLYLLKSLVDSHNGLIEVESEVNIGTKFKIYLNDGKC